MDIVLLVIAFLGIYLLYRFLRLIVPVIIVANKMKKQAREMYKEANKEEVYKEGAVTVEKMRGTSKKHITEDQSIGEVTDYEEIK